MARLVDVSQPFNALAAQVIKSSRTQGVMFVTTNYIIAELVALLHSPMRISRHESIRFIDSLKSAPYVEIVHINETLDAAAWQLLKARADKNWSLADCASFALMQQRNMTDAFTTDHHFEQAGFTRLLK